jgi:hypothetical protein
MIVGSLAEGHEPAAILRQYPQLRLDDVHAALAYAAEVLQSDLLVPLGGGTRANAGGPPVQSEGRFLITADKGLADIRVHPPGTRRVDPFAVELGPGRTARSSPATRARTGRSGSATTSRRARSTCSSPAG